MAETTYIQRFRSASSGQQIALVAVVVVMLAAIVTLVWLFFLRTPYNPLFNGLRATDAATIIAELDRQKIPYRLRDGGGTILVPAEKVDATRLSVMSEDLPLKGTVGFELFNKSDMGLTDFAQRINYQRALQGELARTIMTLDGVEAVRVHLSMGEDRIFRDDRVPPKASVTIHMKPSAILPASAAAGIQRLVAAAVPQLDIANVVILDERGEMVGGQSISSPTGMALTPSAQEKRAIEQYYEAVIRAALAKRAPGDVTKVKVTAFLSPVEADKLHGWNPAARDFRLDVTLDTPLTVGSQEKLAAAVRAAIGSSPALADTITFGRVIQEEPAPQAALDEPAWAPVPATRETGPVQEHGSWLGFAGIVAVVFLGCAMLVAGVRVSRRRAELTTEQRTEFANRLRDALEHDEGRHAI